MWSWTAWVEGAGYGGCIGVDVVKGCPAKAVLGLDACHALLLATAFTGADVELRTGSWRMVNVDCTQISALEERQAPLGAVGIPTRRGTHTQRLSVKPRLQECPFFDLDDEQWKAEAVRCFGLGRASVVQLSESPAVRRRKKPACAMALSQTDLSALENFPKTESSVLEMCSSTATTLTAVQRQRIQKLCLEFPEI